MVWPVRRSWFVRRALGWVAWVCLGLIAFCALVTALFVAAFGHPLAMSIIGLFFAFIPIVVLATAVGVHTRGSVAAGRGWVGFRLFRRWRGVDMGSIRTIRVTRSPVDGSYDAAASGFGGPGFGGPGFGGSEFGDVIDVLSPEGELGRGTEERRGDGAPGGPGPA
jgi:hypothetical protein